MTEEKHNFSNAPEPTELWDASHASDLPPVFGQEAEAQASPAHFAEPAVGEDADASIDPLGDTAPHEIEAAHFAQPAFADGAPADAEPAHFAEPEQAPAAYDAPAPVEEEHPYPEAAHFADGDTAADDVVPAADPLFADLTDHSAAEDDPAVVEDILGDQDTGELPPIDAIEAAAAAAKQVAPGDTAELDAAKVESKLKDPGTTQSFMPLAEERITTDSTYDAGTTTTLMWGARSDVGCVRAHNEDSYLVASPLFAVCDGMGGHAAGEVASSIAVETIAKMSPGTADAARLAAGVEAANAAIIEASANGVGRPGMGCTATVAYIEGHTIAIAHVGDSRAYLMHEGVLTRITHDHSYVEELVDAGEITADEARIHPNRSVITRALGSDPAMYADHFQLNIDEGDRLILCSDGLSSMVPDSEIENIAQKSSTAQMCTDNLVDAALAAGGADNVSVVVVDVVDDGRLKQVIRTHRRNLFISLAALAAALIVGAVITFFSIAGSVYLGVNGETVAVYRGIPATVLGVPFHRLEEETSIKLSDLPEDTRNRLSEGIAQESLEQAWDTLSDYREQISEAQAQQQETADAIRESAEAEEKAKAEAEAAGDAQPQDGGGGEAAPTEEQAAPEVPATTADPNTQTQEGGA